MSMSCFMCEPMETAQSLCDGHMRWLHGQSGHESTDSTLGVVPYVGGLRAWPIEKCSERGRGQK